MKRIWKRILLGSIATAAVIAVGAWVVFTLILVRPATYQPTVVVDAVELRSWPEHDAIYQRTAFPYVLRLESGPPRCSTSEPDTLRRRATPNWPRSSGYGRSSSQP
jgi:hypothetical protein